MVSFESPIPSGSGRVRLERSFTLSFFKFALIRGFFLFYRGIVSPVLFIISGAANGCRFEETCSCYAERQIKEVGFLRSLPLIIKRIVSCNPWVSVYEVSRSKN